MILHLCLVYDKTLLRWWDWANSIRPINNYNTFYKAVAIRRFSFPISLSHFFCHLKKRWSLSPIHQFRLFSVLNNLRSCHYHNVIWGTADAEFVRIHHSNNALTLGDFIVRFGPLHLATCNVQWPKNGYRPRKSILN